MHSVILFVTLYCRGEIATMHTMTREVVMPTRPWAGEILCFYPDGYALHRRVAEVTHHVDQHKTVVELEPAVFSGQEAKKNHAEAKECYRKIGFRQGGPA